MNKTNKAAPANQVHEPITVKVSDVKTAPWNPRTEYDQALVAEIADDIASGRGLIQRPAVVADGNGGYYVVAGNTRLEACRKAGVETVDVELWHVDRQEAMAMTFKENEQRADVYPIQQAKLIGEIFDSGKSVDEIISSTGLKKSSVYDYLAIAKRLAPDMLALAESRPAAFTKTQLKQITDYPIGTQNLAADKWKRQTYATWDPPVYELARETHTLANMKFATCNGSACPTCPANSANIGALPGFEEGKRVATCGDCKCYSRTLKAWREDQLKRKIKVDEKVEISYWQVSSYTATEPSSKNPCAFYYWDGDKLIVHYGPSEKARLAAEKARKEKEAADYKKSEELRERLSAFREKLTDAVKDDLELFRSFIVKCSNENPLFKFLYESFMDSLSDDYNLSDPDFIKSFPEIYQSMSVTESAPFTDEEIEFMALSL